jgi:hypothetical protein
MAYLRHYMLSIYPSHRQELIQVLAMYWLYPFVSIYLVCLLYPIVITDLSLIRLSQTDGNQHSYFSA